MFAEVLSRIYHDPKDPGSLGGVERLLRRAKKLMRYLLIVIDVFAKFAWAIPVHSKDAKAITAAFGQVLTTANLRHPRRLQTDKSKEFYNSNFQALMKRHGIQHFASESKQKVTVVERFNRIIKTRIWIYLSDRGTVH